VLRRVSRPVCQSAGVDVIGLRARAHAKCNAGDGRKSILKALADRPGCDSCVGVTLASRGQQESEAWCGEGLWLLAGWERFSWLQQSISPIGGE
jgi:hypothetical protein